MPNLHRVVLILHCAVLILHRAMLNLHCAGLILDDVTPILGNAGLIFDDVDQHASRGPFLEYRNISSLFMIEGLQSLAGLRE